MREFLADKFHGSSHKDGSARNSNRDDDTQSDTADDDTESETDRVWSDSDGEDPDEDSDGDSHGGESNHDWEAVDGDPSEFPYPPGDVTGYFNDDDSYGGDHEDNKSWPMWYYEDDDGKYVYSEPKCQGTDRSDDMSHQQHPE